MGKPKLKSTDKTTSLNHENALCESKDSSNLVQNEQNITSVNDVDNQTTHAESSSVPPENSSLKENVEEFNHQDKIDSTKPKTLNENKIINEVFNILTNLLG